MPQLSPLNWIFLFLLFWAAVLLMSVIIWWTNKIYYQSESLTEVTLKQNKWNW
uniref:ATP synthase complex subunit 8 n=1 Tax=Terebellum terebellum TaxID=2821813 RepID=A0A8A6KH19_9CAEN|nr:ATP synthase F0 subunit 8 [Terebellum terebellum]QTI82456.1 ATP synthase F0 subunit 8 [Terebellum terebellum]